MKDDRERVGAVVRMKTPSSLSPLFLFSSFLVVPPGDTLRGEVSSLGLGAQGVRRLRRARVGLLLWVLTL